MKFRMLAATAALALSAGAHAAAFSDNFNTDTLGTDVTPTGWSLSSGTNDVDVIGNGFFDFLPGNGLYIDLGGSNGQPGPAVLTSPSFATTLGQAYVATFELAGNQRDGASDTVTVWFGSTEITPTLTSSEGFTTFSISATGTGTPMTLSFADSRDGNVGALLDNVSVNAVPEPGSLSLMLAGFAALGVVARRRRS